MRTEETTLRATALRSRFVVANGVKTHYSEVGGDEPVIVALHGGGHGSSGRAGMGALMLELGADFRVIAPDSVGGYGETDPFVPTPHGLLDRVKHVADFADALCLDRFTILGNSQGAWAAAQYAILHPDRVERIVLISSLTIAESLGIKQPPTAGVLALRGYDGTREGMRGLLAGLIVDPAKITDELIDRRQASATRPGALEAMTAFNKATATLRTDPLLSLQMDMRTTLPRASEHIPTIFLWGLQDTFARPETGRALEAALPSVPFHWIDGAGHQLQTDQPAQVAAIIRSFIQSAA